MKLARNLVPLAALGNALVILTEEMLAEVENPANQLVRDGRSWLDAVAAKTTDSLQDLQDMIFPPAEVPDDITIARTSELESAAALLFSQALSVSTELDLFDHPPPHHPPHHPHHPPPHHPPPHETSDKTIYELLQLSNHTKTFLSLVSEYDSLVDTLNSTAANYTLFVPTDEAFAKIPPGHEKPSKEALEAFLKYHVVDGHLTTRDLWLKHTLPTLLEERFIGDEKQRIRVRFSFRGVTVNAYSHVVASNIFASNGVVHGLDNVLIPPLMVGKQLSLLPTYFSTLLYAYDKTDFVSFIHNVHMVGTTVFAPTNHAFAKLGHRANAFLFETERGRGFLKALLKYQIVANVTLYSDAIYEKTEDDTATGGSNTHYELKTLLDDKNINVDIWKWGGWTKMRINKRGGVVFEDAISKNGVIQIVDSVPLPPCKHKDGGNDDFEDMEISVEDLVERLGGWMEEQESVKVEDQVVFGDL